MALPSFSVTCGYIGPRYNRNKSSPPLFGRIAWQEAPSSGVASNNTVPAATDAEGFAVYRAHAVADCWLSYGRVPNSATAIRVPVPANTDCEFYPEPGDKFMWGLS
jgi:hypothetical protein